MTAAATAAATSSCSGRRQPRHGREAFRARGGKTLVVNRPERDEFTSVDQLERMGKRMRGGEEGANGGGFVDVEIVPGVGHFQLESPGYDELVA